MVRRAVPLSAARMDDALLLMREFYAEEALEYRDSRARGALEGLLAEPARGGFHFLEADGRMAGYFVLTMGYSLEFGGRFALLDEFYVRPELRGAGLGTWALERIAEEAARRGAGALRLEVDRVNTRARTLYERSGFVAHERDLMTKRLAR